MLCEIETSLSDGDSFDEEGMRALPLTSRTSPAPRFPCWCGSSRHFRYFSRF
jgi:hypothetical protein